jgi:hypothetical protein
VAGDAPSYLLAARKAMSECVSRFPSGQGVLKAKEVLANHGLTRVADVKPEKADALIADFNKAA